MSEHLELGGAKSDVVWSGALGKVESSFGQTGKVKVYFPKGMGGPVNLSEGESAAAADKDKPRVRSKWVLDLLEWETS